MSNPIIDLEIILFKFIQENINDSEFVKSIKIYKNLIIYFTPFQYGKSVKIIFLFLLYYSY